MKLFILILILLLFLSLFINTKEGASNAINTFPIPTSPGTNIYDKMAGININSAGVVNDTDIKKDIRYFNSATNIMFGYERIPIIK